MIIAYIDRCRGRFGVEPICTVLSEHGGPIAPSNYNALAKTPLSEPELAQAYPTNAGPA